MPIEPFSLRLRTAPRPVARLTSFESLEYRIALSVSELTAATSVDVQPLMDMPDEDPHADHQMYPGGVMVTPTEIHTEHDVIPRFAADPTNMTVRSGNWSDPRVWSSGRVPTNGDRVVIVEGHKLYYNSLSSVRLDAVEISGSLLFSVNSNTRMLVANLTVMPTGKLQIGNAAAPVQADVKAELVIADKPLDLAKDPRQFGTGMIVLGEISIRGAAIGQTWQRLAVEPRAGSYLLTLSTQPSGWEAGDTLVLPDSRQVPTSQDSQFSADALTGQWESVVIDQIVGNWVVLKTALKFDHLGARNIDGQLELVPHVALLSRNVVIRSENPNGTRGHTFYTARAGVDIEFARFQDLGRTDAFRDLDSSTFDADGMPTHIGTNQVGRYAVHLHHLLGPENSTNTGYQFKFVGNTVEDSKKWAVALHGTSFGLVDRNVVYGAQGAGIVTEDGSEIGNLLTNNITIRMQGTHVDGKEGTLEGDYGRGGSGFWFRRGGNTVAGNVATDSTFAGFVYSGYHLGAMRLPLFRGADTHDPMETAPGDLTPSTMFVSNEAYGMSRYGMWAAYISGNNMLSGFSPTLVYNLKLWNILQTGVLAYHTSQLTFDRLLILGNWAAQDRNDTGTQGMDFRLYENLNLVIRNSRIEGLHYGIITPTSDASQAGFEQPTVISNSTLKNYINIVVQPAHDNAVSAGSVLEVRNVKFQMVTNLPAGPYPESVLRKAANIDMHVTGEMIDYVRPSVVRVYDYNQVKDDNFQVFYLEQRATFTIPKTDPALLSSRIGGVIGSPESRLSNAQNWAKYGLAMGGAVAPTTARMSRSEINGMVAAIQTAPAVPRFVFITPWDNASVASPYLRIRYNVIGQLPAGAQVYLQLDGGTLISDFKDGGLFGIASGNHTLRGYLGDASGRLLSGTSVVTVSFDVN
jgi:hypothetical protein